jgi:hypothetical protein
MRNVDFGGSASGLTFNAGVLADLVTTITYKALGFPAQPLHCAANMDPKALNGDFKLLPINETNLPYRMEIRSASETRVHVSCRLPLGLGTWRRGFVLGELAPNVSTGNLELGLTDSGVVTLPAEVGGAEFKYRITLSSPVIETTAESIVFQSDVNVEVEH